MQLNLNALDINPDNLVFTLQENSRDNLTPDELTHNDQTAPLFLNRMLLDAVKTGASDIHFEPFEESLRIRLRVDGVMQEINHLPTGFGRQLIIRLKVIAGLDISEHHGTQSGRFRMLLDDKTGLDFRCSITPTLYGETVVLRLLHLPSELLDLTMLGLSQPQIQLIQHVSQRLQGMILVTGPTGSGKTVTLYTLLKQLNNHQRNIYTVEDPVEINLPGVNQINISARQSITFANIARSILRQDPDVIMLGEMRDEETIDTAIKASHTGHLVLSTLHATSATKAIPRLRNLGVNDHNIGSTLSLVISQRLLRKLDPNSRERDEVSPQRLKAIGFKDDEIAELQLYRAKPSDTSRTGYKGRIGIFQVLPINHDLEGLIATGANDQQLEIYAEQQGLASLRQSALDKLKAGITDINEVQRVLGLAENRIAE
ncbi:Flp pilus assembly complex ATPase component TadA [Pontibacterium sp. N1Y112]|uniref:Flp pilus assembly complex ATPase component TadA n=1 Tax=Pontibacterium sinense TaxID=2781979 RepID=A0A8J7FEZ4_9GAMM|nr:ATPase, T2SS/T4P/T4SS family [Pontibacterium sinense]MBE9398857.1 Flp pilus assembly complex ATPase component TadA [Pontibacterium sinense]